MDRLVAYVQCVWVRDYSVSFAWYSGGVYTSNGLNLGLGSNNRFSILLLVVMSRSHVLDIVLEDASGVHYVQDIADAEEESFIRVWPEAYFGEWPIGNYVQYPAVMYMDEPVLLVMHLRSRGPEPVVHYVTDDPDIVAYNPNKLVYLWDDWTHRWFGQWPFSNENLDGASEEGACACPLVDRYRRYRATAKGAAWIAQH